MTREQLIEAIAYAFKAEEGMGYVRREDRPWPWPNHITIDGDFDLDKIADHVLAAVAKKEAAE